MILSYTIVFRFVCLGLRGADSSDICRTDAARNWSVQNTRSHKIDQRPAAVTAVSSD